MKPTASQTRELNAWCEVLYKMTIEFVENPTKAMKFLYKYCYRDIWSLGLFPKPLASVEAHRQFKDLTGLDIRDYDWESVVKAKDGTRIVVHQHFMNEHLTTASDFKHELIKAYKDGKLNVPFIKDLISKQRICWITRHGENNENDRLTNLGYSKSRPDPYKAYREAEIDFYED